MNAVRITYLLCNLVLDLALTALAVCAPVWITPGVYWWTAFAIFAILLESVSFTKRINSWGVLGDA